VIKVRWLKPDNINAGLDDETDMVGQTYLISQFADFQKSDPFVIMRDRGYLHLEKNGVELLLWDPDRVMPIMTAGIPEVKWLEATNVHSK